MARCLKGIIGIKNSNQIGKVDIVLMEEIRLNTKRNQSPQIK
jgi:hypothetical protein